MDGVEAVMMWRLGWCGGCDGVEVVMVQWL